MPQEQDPLARHRLGRYFIDDTLPFAGETGALTHEQFARKAGEIGLPDDMLEDALDGVVHLGQE